MNNQEHTDLPESEIRLLGIYKCVQEGKLCQMTMDDIAQLPQLVSELKDAEIQDKSKLDKIEKLETGIQERMIQIQALRSQLNPKLLYLASHETKLQPMKTVTNNHTVKTEYAMITEDAIMQVLKDSPGLGNSSIAEKLNLDNSKGIQNKIYSVVKKLQAENKLSVDRQII